MVIPDIPLAFGFSNLAMLGWLGAAAAPILIHLWMRHTHRDTPWAAMEFLREAIKRNARRLKLQQWLLLAVRTLLLLLVALAAAKPYLSGWNILTGGPKVHRILVLDASMSMQYRAGDESVFERARQLATEAIDQGRPGDVYSLLLLASPPQTIVAGPVADARGVTAQLQSLEPTYGDASLGALMTTITNLISESEATHRDLSGHEVLLFTDLANSTWQQATGDAPAAEEIRKLAARAKLTVVDLGPTDPSNVAAHGTRIAGTLATIVDPLRIECDVTNYGDVAKSNVVVELLQDGTSIDEHTVTLPAGGSATVTFDAKIAQPGWTSLAVRTNDDALTPDDVGWLAVDVREQVRALLVEGESGAARYLQHALEPGSNLSPIEATVVSEGELMETPLEEFDAIFLCNVARFTSSERELLARYVEQGGTLVFFLGDRVLAETYNEVLASAEGLQKTDGALSTLLYEPKSQSPALQTVQSTSAEVPSSSIGSLLPVTIGPLETSGTSGINPLDYAHPIAAAFRGSERAGLLSTPVNRFYQLTPREGAEVALALPNGEPLLVTAAYGRGMVAVVATSATLDTVDRATAQPWTLMPAWPSFLPIVRELVAYGMGASRLQSERTIGELLDGRLPASWSDTTIAITRPDGRTDIVPVERGAGAEWSYASSDEPGIFAVEDATSSRVIAKIAVNVPGDESNVARVDTQLLPDELAIETASLTSGSAGTELLADTSLHRTLLYVVLALLLIEPVMAWVFAGRGA
ncbi:BatA domain-containing protein [Aeoliella sp. SH292]|uniref:BatA domain-containing protein n=1 Tax=Aeoliella sp. SH292 TaxID=3454464 RepID=UPI003F9BE56B